MKLEKALKDFKDLQAKQCAFDHALSLLQFDGVTTAPKGTAENRARTASVLSEELYKLSTGNKTVNLLEYLESRKNELTDKERRTISLVLKDIRKMQRIPINEYVAYEKMIIESDDIWHTAKERNDFSMFLPYLEKIFDYTRRFATYCSPDKNPYDYCIDQYSEGLDMNQCDTFFAALKGRIVPLLHKISEKDQLSDDCIRGHFKASAQKRFALELMDIIGLDKNHCGLAETEHPFTTTLGSHYDVRITTNYYTENVSYSMYSVMHEGGHALYELGSDKDLAYTYLDGASSMSIHESQSRFYENLLGRSREFTDFIFPKMRRIFNSHMKRFTADDLYRAVNLVTPSLIRTEADEVTYCLHIMVRYDLEKQVMSGELQVKDLPDEWNKQYKLYLGIDVPDDRHGILQDSHWSGGLIGYFPSYALGSAYGAHFIQKMNESFDVASCLKKGDFRMINEWNNAKIWKYGSYLSPSEILDNVLGEPFDPFVYTDYLENKYTELYEL